MELSLCNPASCPSSWITLRCAYTIAQSSPADWAHSSTCLVMPTSLTSLIFLFLLLLLSDSPRSLSLFCFFFSNLIVRSEGRNLRYIFFNPFISLCFPDAKKPIWVNSNCVESISQLSPFLIAKQLFSMNSIVFKKYSTLVSTTNILILSN